MTKEPVQSADATLKQRNLTPINALNVKKTARTQMNFRYQNPLLEQKKLDMLKRADKTLYVKQLCREIIKNTQDIQLPKLLRIEMTELKRNLIDYKKIKDDDIRYKFLNLRNAFLIINEIEDDPDKKQLIHPILKYLYQFRPIFDMIIENQGRNTPEIELELALQLLNFQINLFCIKYHYITADTDIGVTFTTSILKKQDTFKDKPREPEYETPEAEPVDEDGDITDLNEFEKEITDQTEQTPEQDDYEKENEEVTYEDEPTTTNDPDRYERDTLY